MRRTKRPEPALPPNPFLAEVLKHPDDDVPRLVYADWLEEQGDPRGEFIRVQCELAQTNDLQPEYYDLLDRSEELLAAHGEAWASEIKQDIRKSEFHRGFIDTITTTARSLVKDDGRLLSTTPVHWLRFNYLKNYGSKVAELASLTNLRHLDISRLKIPEEDYFALLNSPNLNQLQGLNVSHPDIGFQARHGKALATGSFAPSLEELSLRSDYGYRPDFFRNLASGEGFPQLKKLELGTYNIPELDGLGDLQVPPLESLMVGGILYSAHLGEIAKLPLHQLRRLDLSGTNSPGKGVSLLVEGGCLDLIEDLNLSECTITSELMRQMFSGEQFSKCRSLQLQRIVNLSVSQRMSSLIEAIATHRPLENLERLKITHLEDADFKTLTRSECLKSLRLLHADAIHFDDSSASALLDSPLQSQLAELRLRGNITQEAILRLSEGSFPELVNLNLGGDYFLGQPYSPDEMAVIRLLQSNAFPNLRKLQLSNGGFGSDVLHAIAKMPHLGHLRRLELEGCEATHASLRAVLEAEQLKKVKVTLTFVRGIHRPDELVREFPGRIFFRP